MSEKRPRCTSMFLHYLHAEIEIDNSKTELITNCNFILQSDLFMSLILFIGKCLDCVGAVVIEHLLNAKMGLARFLMISCTECPWNLRFRFSKQFEKLIPRNGRTGYWTIIAFRENCIGFSSIESFYRYMNMPPAMSKTTFEDKIWLIHNAYVSTIQDQWAELQVRFMLK